MIDFPFLLLIILAAFGLCFFCLWLAEATRWRPNGHHHLIPPTPRSYRARR